MFKSSTNKGEKMKFDLSYKVSPNQDRVFARGIEANNFEDAQSKLIEYWLERMEL